MEFQVIAGQADTAGSRVFPVIRDLVRTVVTQDFLGHRAIQVFQGQEFRDTLDIRGQGQAGTQDIAGLAHRDILDIQAFLAIRVLAAYLPIRGSLVSLVIQGTAQSVDIQVIRGFLLTVDSREFLAIRDIQGRVSLATQAIQELTGQP